MSNTRSKVKLEASEKRRRQGLDDELWRHINMLGQTGRDLETTKRKTQQGDKPRLNSNGTQTGERKETKNDPLCGADYSLNTQQSVSGQSEDEPHATRNWAGWQQQSNTHIWIICQHKVSDNMQVRASRFSPLHCLNTVTHIWGPEGDTTIICLLKSIRNA